MYLGVSKPPITYNFLITPSGLLVCSCCEFSLLLTPYSFGIVVTNSSSSSIQLSSFLEKQNGKYINHIFRMAMTHLQGSLTPTTCNESLNPNHSNPGSCYVTHIFPATHPVFSDRVIVHSVEVYSCTLYSYGKKWAMVIQRHMTSYSPITSYIEHSYSPQHAHWGCHSGW